MNFKKNSDIIFGIIILAFGLVYFLLTQQVEAKPVIVSARFIPNVLAVSMFALGTLQLIAGYKKAKAFKDGGAQEKEKIDYATVIKTLVSIVIYIALLDIIGFLITTAVYLFTQFIILTPVTNKKNYVSYAVIAIVTSSVIYFTFRNALDLMLPAGIL